VRGNIDSGNKGDTNPHPLDIIADPLNPIPIPRIPVPHLIRGFLIFVIAIIVVSKANRVINGRNRRAGYGENPLIRDIVSLRLL
jgi:hypothetical protein